MTETERYREIPRTEHEDSFIAIATVEFAQQIEATLSQARQRSFLRRDALISPALPTSAETIEHGTVCMEEHPDFKETLDQVTALGYTVVPNCGHPYVSLRKITVRHEDGAESVYFEKELNVVPGMRFIDLEHELGHIDQIESRLYADPHFCTSAFIEENGIRHPDKLSPGLMKSWQDSITECHNRLIEFIRLHKRQVDDDTLIEHLVELETHYINYYRRGIKCGYSRRQIAWRDTYFPEIPKLVEEVDSIILERKLRKHLRGRRGNNRV